MIENAGSRGEPLVRPNRTFGRIGMRFRQDESCEHWIRSSRELEEIVTSVESSPVNAGPVDCAALVQGKRHKSIVRPT